MKLAIIFIGLISHITLNPGTRNEDHFAALVRDDNHRAEIIVPKGKEVFVQGATKFDALFADAEGQHYSIKDHKIWIDGSTGITSPSTDFNSLVINLADVSDAKNPSADIMAKNFKTGVAQAIVDLKAGPLDVHTLWSKHVDAGKLGKDCVSRSTIYTLPGASTGTVDILSDDGRLLRITAGTTITIKNSAVNVAKGEHFEMYKLFTDATKIDVPAANMGKACTNAKYGKVNPTKGDSVECSDTHFP